MKVEEDKSEIDNDLETIDKTKICKKKKIKKKYKTPFKSSHN